MPLYTFSGPANPVVRAKGHSHSGYTTVEADDESQARERAMTSRWGPSGDAVVPFKYKGIGLTLVDVAP